MALPDWPDAVSHRPERAYWSGTPFRPPLATDMEGGNTRLRAQPGDDVGTYAWGRTLSAAEMAAFQTFVTTTLGNGARRFRMQVSRDGITYEPRTVQIVPGSLKYAAAGGPNTLVQLSLLVLPPGVIA